MFEIEPLSSSLRLGNMVGGLGWLRRRVCTCRLGSPPPASYPLEDGFFALSRFCIADHGPPKMPGAVQTCGIASSRRALSPYPIFIAPGFILFSEVGRIRSAGFCWINLMYAYAYAASLNQLFCNRHLFRSGFELVYDQSVRSRLTGSLGRQM